MPPIVLNGEAVAIIAELRRLRTPAGTAGRCCRGSSCADRGTAGRSYGFGLTRLALAPNGSSTSPRSTWPSSPMARQLHNWPMHIPRRRFLHLAAGALALPAIWRVARAQTYPVRPVRIIVGFPPGGVADIYARLIGRWLSERLGQSYLVESRQGAGGNVATESVVRAAPDGYTLLLTSSGDAWNATLYESLRFNFIRDIAPVAGISRSVGVLLVHPSFPSKSASELIAYSRHNPAKITVGSAGVGSLPHVYWEMFRSLAAVDMLHVPYRGGGPALTDLLGNQIQVYFGTTAATLEYIKAGNLRA